LASPAKNYHTTTALSRYCTRALSSLQKKASIRSRLRRHRRLTKHSSHKKQPLPTQGQKPFHTLFLYQTTKTKLSQPCLMMKILPPLSLTTVPECAKVRRVCVCVCVFAAGIVGFEMDGSFVMTDNKQRRTACFHVDPTQNKAKMMMLMMTTHNPCAPSRPPSHPTICSPGRRRLDLSLLFVGSDPTNLSVDGPIRLPQPLTPSNSF
jgi:hypothetical protein